MDKKIQIDNRGFSLIELLVCLAISAFVIVSALSLVMVGTQNYDKANKSTSLQQEMTFITNLVGQSIREGNQAESSITKWSSGGSDGDVEIHTGKKVICYDKSETSLYVYDRDVNRPIGSYYDPSASDFNDHLISKYVTDFSAEYVGTKYVKDASGNLIDSEPAHDYNNKVGGAKANALGVTENTESSLIKIKVTVKVKDKSDTTEVIYQIRS